MAQDLVLNLDDATIESYRHKARLNGISLEEELRNLLEANRSFTPDERVAASRWLRAQFATEEWDAAAAVRWGRDDEFLELLDRADAA